MRAAAALSLIALAGCERAGADFENATKQPVEISSALLPNNAHGARNTFVLRPGEVRQSVWYVDEHRLLRFKSAAGSIESFEGSSLAQLSNKCPKHCILRYTDSGVEVVRTNLFGHPEE